MYIAINNLNLNGVKAPYKFVPNFVFNQSSNNIKELLLGHFMGDGCQCGITKCHYTSSIKLANDLQKLIFLSGSEAGIAIKPPAQSIIYKKGIPRIIKGNFPSYRVSVRSLKNMSLDRKYLFKEMYNGEIFGAEMPTYHTLVTRRNYKI